MFKVFLRNYLRSLRLFGVGMVITTIILLYNTVKVNHYDEDILQKVSKSSMNYLQSDNINYSDNIILSDFVQSVKNDVKILNLDVFGAVTDDTIILVILLDKFSSSFKYILSSLSQITGIEEALVIFSHSNYDKNLHRVINRIDFCRVLQIYYPYSVQTHPDDFPVNHAKDCAHDLNYKNTHCHGALFPNIRGYLRNPTKAERKHHWWWTANAVFENLSSTAKHTGLVIFSENNFIFMKDFIYMASYMKYVSDSLPQCEFISLGSDTSPNEGQKSVDRVELSSWNPKKHSNILAFDLSAWDSIVSHYDIFCTIDDASWSRSLYYVSVHRRDGERFKTISAVTPRAYKIDSCDSDFRRVLGFHRCDLLQNVLRVVKLEAFNERNWFPPYLELYINVELEDEEDVIFDYSESDGGWADPRDWALCRNMTAGKIKKVLMEMKNEFSEYFGDKN